MARQNYYLLSSLPVLGELGSEPPLTLSDMLKAVGQADGPQELVAAILLGDDLLQREAFLTGEIEQVEPAVLTAAQARNEEPMPEYLAIGQEHSERTTVTDILWAAYFYYAASVAQRRAGKFLAAWVNYEVSMRNALASARAKALGLGVEDYLVVRELGGEEDFSALIAEWSAAVDPLEGLQIIDKARWNWLIEHDGWFTFADDEVASYAAKAMLLTRWSRVKSESQNGPWFRPRPAGAARED